MRTTIADPFSKHEEVTLSDSEDIAMGVCRGFYSNQAGNLKVTDRSGREVTIPVQAGLNPSQVRRFWSTGSDAGFVIVGGG